MGSPVLRSALGIAASAAIAACGGAADGPPPLEPAVDCLGAEECFQLGQEAEDAAAGEETIDQKYARVASYYEAACQDDHAGACIHLARQLAMGMGVAQDQEGAVSRFERACDLGSAEGCAELAGMIERGWGIAPDRAAALALYEEACDAGHNMSCHDAKRLR